ncbi:uncharacterized protein LOC134242654 [Saccostrea cucullata]|uniref:uncharacterized protein LOC134242654 n=1 Tax=Saccostrea cuccullata TaxID=36930 RepID=UPI002ED30B1E
MCSNCLENTDFCTTTKICKAFGCKQEFSSEEIKLALRNSPEIMVWRYFEIANYLQCDRGCNNQAILKVTLCRHSYCFPCLHQKEYSSAYTYCNRDVILCSSTCNVEIPRSVVQNCFLLFRKEAIMTAITLELSKEKCIRCKDEDLKTLRIKNRFCSYSHAYCILCCEYMKAGSLREQRPWLMSDVIEEQIGCIHTLCKSYTPLKCLDVMVETLTGKNIQTEIFIRNANFPRNCNGCRTAEADIVFVRCSHGFCVGCIDSRMQERSNNGYLQCIYRGCSTLIPLFVISELPKSIHWDGKSSDINGLLVGNICGKFY